MPVTLKSNSPYVKLSLLDKAVSFVNPTWGMHRVQYKAGLSAINTGFVTPRSNKRSMFGWFTSGGSADKDTLNDLTDSRSGARDLYMNTPMATAIIRRLQTNVIGYGLNVQSRVDREFLGLTDEQANKWERDAEREFRLWSTSKNCDISRTNTFSQLQSLAFISKIMSGDVFALLPYKAVKGSPYELRIKLIESDQVSNPGDYENPINMKLRGGVEVDKEGAPVAYHIRKVHPGDYTMNREWVRVPAFGAKTGRKNVLHIYTKERPGQRRGMSCLAPILEQLKQLTRLSEAELMGALVASFFTVFIKKVSGNRPLEEGFVPDDMVQDPTTDRGEKNYEMKSGNIVTLDDEQEVDIADPKRPNDSFEPFFLAIVKQLGASTGIPFEILMMHFSKNYSASRGAVLEAWKTFKTERKFFVIDFNQPIYEEVITEAVIKGRLVAPGFLTDSLTKLAWLGSRWGGIGQGHIDPMKETKASIFRINNQLSTYEDEAQVLGNDDWENSIDRLSKEKQLLKEKELISEEPEEDTIEDVTSTDNANT